MQTCNRIAVDTGSRRHSTRISCSMQLAFCGYMKGRKHSGHKMRSPWRWMRNRICKHSNELILHSPCVRVKLNGKSLSMNGMALSIFWPCSTFTVAKCEVAVWIKTIANTFAELYRLCYNLFAPFVVFTWSGMAVPAILLPQQHLSCAHAMARGYGSFVHQLMHPGSTKLKFCSRVLICVTCSEATGRVA